MTDEDLFLLSMLIMHVSVCGFFRESLSSAAAYVMLNEHVLVNKDSCSGCTTNGDGH